MPSANTFVRYDGIGLPSNVIYRIEEDEKGLFWVSTNKGLVHFNPKNSSFKVYTVANGLLSNQFNYQSSYKDKNGRIYLAVLTVSSPLPPPPLLIMIFTLCFDYRFYAL